MLASPTLALTAAAAAALLAGPAAAHRPLVQHDRRVTLIDPSSGSYNFSGVLRTQALCDRPCKPLVDIQSSCNTEDTCVEGSLCTTTGLNSLVACNNCLLQLANKTTGVTEAFYQNTSTILTDTESACADSPSASSSTPVKANVTVLPWSAFVPTTSTAKSTNGSTTESIGSAGDKASAANTTSAAGPSWATGGRAVAAVVGVVMAGLAIL